MNKRLGQHFLVNKKAVNKIIEALDLKSGDVVIEVGPGHGELTFELLRQQPARVITIEKDKKMVLDLRLKNIEVIEGDVLKILPKVTADLKEYKLMGNIPYYLTGYLLRKISELDNKPSLIVFTLQKEVAERIIAKPPKMNLLAASVQFWAKPEIMMTLAPSSFEPEPKVESAIVRLKPLPTGRQEKKLFDAAESKRYFAFIKILFKQPRKTILNNLADGLGLKKEELKEKLTALGISEKDRPQNLDLNIIDKLSLLC